jgi:hypothetical protein
VVSGFLENDRICLDGLPCFGHVVHPLPPVPFKRAYWHCVIMESALHTELDLPLTGIIGLEDRVGIPSFNTPFCEADHRGNQSSHFEAHYASQVALRRLCSNLHNNIYECKFYALHVP